MSDRPLPSVRARIAIHATEIIPSAAVLELEGEQRRVVVREQIKERMGVRSEDDVRRMLDALLEFPGLVEPASDLLMKALPLYRAIDLLDALLDNVIEGAYSALRFAGVKV